MKKIFLGVIAAAAVAVPLVATAGQSHASVSVDTDSTGVVSGFVGKGDVQTTLGYNNKQMQDAVIKGDISFTQTRDLVTEWSWTNADGTTHHLARTESVVRPLSASVARTNSEGKDGPMTGWNIAKQNTDRWAYVGGVYTPTFTGDDANSDGSINQKDLFYAADGSVPTLPDVNGDGIPDAPLQHFVFTTQVNNFALPNTPVV